MPMRGQLQLVPDLAEPSIFQAEELADPGRRGGSHLIRTTAGDAVPDARSLDRRVIHPLVIPAPGRAWFVFDLRLAWLGVMGLRRPRRVLALRLAKALALLNK